jgi:transposase
MGNEARHPNALSAEQRAELDAFMHDPSTPKRLVDRARIIWLARDGASTKSVAQGLSLTSLTVSKWKRRYRVAGIAGLYDLARPGQPRKLSAAQRDEIIRYTRRAVPERGARWSIRQMALFAGVTQHQVRQIWNAAQLTPATNPGVPLDHRIELGLWDLRGVAMDAERTLAVFKRSKRSGTLPATAARRLRVAPSVTVLADFWRPFTRAFASPLLRRAATLREKSLTCETAEMHRAASRCIS